MKLKVNVQDLLIQVISHARQRFFPAVMAAPMTPAALKRLKVAEVRDLLTKEGLDASGTKEVMVHRYETFLWSPAASNTASAPVQETPTRRVARGKDLR